jgi:hypothetical protein
VLVVLAVLGGTPQAASAIGARLRWAPSEQEPGGYRVYVREAGTPYGAPLDVGMPPLDPDGTHAWVVEDLGADRTYYFAVSAYGPNGIPSRLSRELALGPTDPCVVDRCITPTRCEFAVHPDETPCLGPERCGVCQAGVCHADAGHALGVRRLRLRAGPRGVRLRATAAIALPAPAAGGVAIQLTNAERETLYRAAVPPEAMQRSRSGRRLRLVDRAAVDASAPGLQALTLRLRRHSAFIGLRIANDRLAAAFTASPLTLALQLDSGECLLEQALGCTTTADGVACR